MSHPFAGQGSTVGIGVGVGVDVGVDVIVSFGSVVGVTVSFGSETGLSVGVVGTAVGFSSVTVGVTFVSLSVSFFASLPQAQTDAIKAQRSSRLNTFFHLITFSPYLSEPSDMHLYTRLFYQIVFREIW